MKSGKRRTQHETMAWRRALATGLPLPHMGPSSGGAVSYAYEKKARRWFRCDLYGRRRYELKGKARRVFYRRRRRDAALSILRLLGIGRKG